MVTYLKVSHVKNILLEFNYLIIELQLTLAYEGTP